MTNSKVCAVPSLPLKVKDADRSLRLVFAPCNRRWGRLRHNCTALMPAGYRFFQDPLWWVACLAYAANRFLIAPLVGGKFLHGQFDDLWLIPAALPVVLDLQSRLRLRPSGVPPSGVEVFIYWLLWSIISEGGAPLVLPRAVGDWRDVIAYGIGALIAAIWWRKRWPAAHST